MNFAGAPLKTVSSIFGRKLRGPLPATRVKLLHRVVAALLLFYYGIVHATFADENVANARCANATNCSLSHGFSMTCDTRQLTAIPKCAENLETLIVQSGFVQRLFIHDFPPTLGTLKILAVKNVFLRQVRRNSFENLPKLRELDLSMNFLQFVDPELFANNVYLERLNLSSNKIKRLVANQFPLPHLKILDLSSCGLETVDEAAFTSAASLDWLNLRTNKLRTIAFRANVSVMLLHDNPWNCECVVYNAIKKYDTDENEKLENSSLCLDAERSQLKSWNDTNFAEDVCDEEIQLENTYKTRRERSSREENAPDLIITIYGYVFVALSVLICMCCCCDKPKTRKIANCR